MEKKLECVNCNGKYPEEETYQSDDGKVVCENCFLEADPITTIVYSGDQGEYPNDEGEGSKDIITEFHNPTGFKIEWHNSDGWRGYYEVVESPGLINVHSDCILSRSEDASELENFDEKLETFCRENGILFVKVFCMTSNLFSGGYDFFVDESRVDDVKELIKELEEKHRDPARFNSTALTGTDPKDQTEYDNLVLGTGLIDDGQQQNRLLGGELNE